MERIGNAYWSGQHVEDNHLESWGQKWTEEPIIEALFIGRVEFYDRNLKR